MLTIEELRTIRAAMTWGDQRYGLEQAGDDDPSGMVAHALHRTAKRLGTVESDTTFEDFLDAVRMGDLQAVLDEDRSPTIGVTTA